MNKEEILMRMQNKKLYFSDDATLMALQTTCLDKVHAYNQLKPSMKNEKKALLKEMFASIGEGCHIETPFYANWGGLHVHFGKNVYANFNLVLVDDCDIFVGDCVMFGPNVVVATGTHPVDPTLRRKQAQYNLPIHIQDNVWIGANSVIMAGVTIGENTIIGAGSVVTKDIPANVVAVGNPCKVMRAINEQDQEYYYREYKIDIK